jgi:hypothetical protein
MKNPFEAAILKGMKAKSEGKTLLDNPYKDIKKQDGRLTFARAFRNAWAEGWHRQNQLLNTTEWN